jgi:hypothetical protein
MIGKKLEKLVLSDFVDEGVIRGRNLTESVTLM